MAFIRNLFSFISFLVLLCSNAAGFVFEDFSVLKKGMILESGLAHHFENHVILFVPEERGAQQIFVGIFVKTYIEGLDGRL